MVDLLLQHGARLKGNNAILEAAIYGKLEMVKYLLSKGADIDEVGIKGPPGDECCDEMGSSLHQAATKGYTEMALFLIDAGANIYLKDPIGRTAEDLALENDHTEILDALRRKMSTVKE
ncbi:ankyrin repeat-containing domain protein [Aspergillus spinulosporus]